MPAISVVGSTGSLVRRAVRGLESRGLALAASESATDHASLAGALDAAARHPATACVLVYAHRVGAYQRFAGVCQAVTPHLPVVFVPAGDFASDAFIQPWLESTGAVRQPSLSRALDALPVVAALDLPSDNRCIVVGGDEALLASAGAAAARAGFEVVIRKGATLADTLGELSHDLVVTAIEEPADAYADVAIALGAARDAHPELPLVVFADGSSEWAEAIRQSVNAGSVCVLDSSVDLAVGLIALTDWERHRSLVDRQAAKPRDPSRLRRIVRDLKTQDAGLFSPSSQADLVAALGLPAARAVRVPYLEDCLIAAAELGYPLRLAAVHSDMGPDAEPHWVDVPSSEELMECAEVELSATNRAIGRRAELLFSEARLAHAWTLRIQASRHADFGAVVLLSHQNRETVFVPPGPADLAGELRRLGFPPAEASVLTAATDGVSALVGALTEIAPLRSIMALLDIGVTGFNVRHASVTLQEGDR